MFREECKVVKQVYANGDFFIFGIAPLDYDNTQLKLNKYGSATIKGELGFLTEGKTYTFDLEEGKTDNYGTSYIVKDVPSMQMEDLSQLSYEDKMSILMECTTSERLARNILSAYPDFIELILTQGKEAIDVKKIVGVGTAYLNAYSRNLISKYKYYGLCHDSRLKEYELGISEAKALFGMWNTKEDIVNAINRNPYYALIEVCERSYPKADKTILSIREDLKESKQRTEALIVYILKQNENDGSTRLDGTTLFKIVKHDEDLKAPELASYLKDVAVESDYIYFDEKSGDLSVMSTYLAECAVASFIIEKNKNCEPLDIDIEKYRVYNELEVTDEQFQAIKNFRDNRFMLVTGYAGCVDKDTEFFNGKEWKKISDYEVGDMVLQYTEDGKAELVYPNKYIKLPCDKMYHFETKYGINQTLSEDHNMIFDEKYETGHNVRIQHHRLHEMKAKDFVKSFENNTFIVHKHKFRTTFEYDGKGIDLTDDEIKIMCAVICDGSFTNSKNLKSKRCRFHIKKDRKKKALRELFENSNTEYKEVQSSAEGYTDFYIKAPRREKEFSSYWYNCSNHQLQVICDNILQWDGSIWGGRKTFSTTIKQTADFIQFAFSSCGMRTTISTYNRAGKMRGGYVRKSVEYNIQITDRTLVGFTNDRRRNDKTKISIVDTVDGFKYCFNVPSHMLVLRRKDRIFITGNCGKTTVVQSMIGMCDDLGLTYTLIAPTGSASMRLSEQTHRYASTAHLKCLKDGEIRTDVLIIDECSMASLDIFKMVIDCITNDNIRVILIGDDCQLTSVSCGTVFADIIESGYVPNAKLTKVFRYGDSGILYSATNERQGRYFLDDKNVKFNGEDTYSILNNYKFIARSEDETIIDTAIVQYNKLLTKYKSKDILILTGYNVGTCGTITINNKIQSEVNPPKPNEEVLEKRFRGVKMLFRVGDRIINIKNNYNALPLDAYREIQNSNGMLSADDFDLDTVYNGQRGVVIGIENGHIICKFDNQEIVYDKLETNTYLLLAYAITIHKSQGQESKAVITLYSPNQKRVMNRNLLYVGDTRAKELQIDVGDLTTFKSALGVDEVLARNTWTKDLLVSYYENN